MKIKKNTTLQEQVEVETKIVEDVETETTTAPEAQEAPAVEVVENAEENE